MTWSFSLPSLPLGPLGFLASNLRAPSKADYRECTEELYNTGIVIKAEHASLRTEFKDGGTIVDVLTQKLRKAGNWGNSFLRFLPFWPGTSDNPPWNVSRWVWSQIPLERIEPKDDGHAYLTRQTIAALKTAGYEIPFYGNDAEAENVLIQDIDFRDLHPSHHPTFVDFMDIIFNPVLSTTQHALTGVAVDPVAGTVRLEDAETTRRKIRQSFDHYLTLLYQLQLELEQPLPVMIDSCSDDVSDAPEPPWLGILEEGITQMELAFQNGDGKKVISRIDALKPYLFYAKMHGIEIPQGLNDRDTLNNLVEPYRDLLNLIREVRTSWAGNPAKDSSNFRKGLDAYKRILYYVPEADWEKVSQGSGPLLAQAQLFEAIFFHLGQDWVAHCRTWREGQPGEPQHVCTERVSVNLWGLGTLHKDQDDSLTDEDDKLRPQLPVAVQIPLVGVFLLLESTSDTFMKDKEWFLENYFGKP